MSLQTSKVYGVEVESFVKDDGEPLYDLKKIFSLFCKNFTTYKPRQFSCVHLCVNENLFCGCTFMGRNTCESPRCAQYINFEGFLVVALFGKTSAQKASKPVKDACKLFFESLESGKRHVARHAGGQQGPASAPPQRSRKLSKQTPPVTPFVAQSAPSGSSSELKRKRSSVERPVGSGRRSRSISASKAARAPQKAADWETTLAERIVVDMDVLSDVLGEHCRCKHCDGAVFAVNIDRVNLAGQITLTCDAGHNTYIELDTRKSGRGNSRFDLNRDFVFAATVAGTSYSVVEQVLRLFGIDVPSMDNYYSGDMYALEAAVDEVAKLDLHAQRVAVRKRVEADSAYDGKGQSYTFAGDAQYSHIQGKGLPQQAFYALTDPETGRVVDYEVVCREDVPLTMWRPKEERAGGMDGGGIALARTAVLATADAKIAAAAPQDYYKEEFKCLEVIAACKVFERIRQWLGRASAGDKQVHVVTDEHRTIQKIVPEFGFDWSLDTFHREKKLESDWYKHCEVQDKNGRRTNLGMAEKHLLGKMIRNYFRAIMSGRKEDRLAKWEAIPRNLAPETHEDGVEAIKTFVEGYRKFVQATERVDFASTSYNESLHSHNLRFTSKNIFQSLYSPPK